ncbi:MAG: hypothetical protein AAF387_13215, partial [Pseudomonadota bacterium]
SIMPRISEVTDSDDPTVKEIFAAEKDMFGDVLNPTKIAAHCPPILKALKTLYASFYESGLVSPALHCLAYARVASMNGCPF